MASQDNLKELTRCGLFTSIALIIFIVESRLPAPIPIAGAKLGLSNLVTLYVAYTLGIRQASGVLFSRIFLGAIFAGQVRTLFYSAAGGLCCLLCLCLFRPFTTHKELFWVSPLCAISHNIGQILVASWLMGTKAIFYFLPYLLILAIATGLFVGIATERFITRMNALKKS